MRKNVKNIIMIYFTVIENGHEYLLDSISYSIRLLSNKFSDQKIYKSDKPIVTVNISKEQLDRCELVYG